MRSIDQTFTWPGWSTVRLIGRGSFGAVYEIERDVFVEKEKAAPKVITVPQSESDISEMAIDGYDEESIASTFQKHLKSIVAEYSLRSDSALTGIRMKGRPRAGKQARHRK